MLLATLTDLVDAVLDYVLVADLSAQGHGKEAAWLGVQTTLCVLIELGIKLPLHRRKAMGTGEGGAAIDLAKGYGVTFFVLASSLIELSIFLLEDATTILIWWRTPNVFNAGNALSLANLGFTIFSAAAALVGVAVAVKRVAGLKKEMKG